MTTHMVHTHAAGKKNRLKNKLSKSRSKFVEFGELKRHETPTMHPSTRNKSRMKHILVHLRMKALGMNLYCGSLLAVLRHV